MARKKPAKRAGIAVRKSLARARKGTAAAVKPRIKRAAADRKAAVGAIAPWTSAEVEEAFRRLKAAVPEPERISE